jgi:hypothetical protein
VLVGGDEVRDVRFSGSLDVEDEDYDDTNSVSQSRWTCFRECMGNVGKAEVKAGGGEKERAEQMNLWKRLKMDET